MFPNQNKYGNSQNINYLNYIFYNLEQSEIILNYIRNFISNLVRLGTIIPISLYMSLELIRIIQTLFIQSDSLLYSLINRKYLKCLNSNLHEDLSKIEVILTDKTGTLTTNELKFCYASIQGIIYNSKGKKCDKLQKKLDSNYLLDCKSSQDQFKIENFEKWYCKFMECMLLCNGSITLDDTSNLIHICPDEEAFLRISKNFDYEILEKKVYSAKLKYKLIMRNYTILDIIPFTPRRKCMTVIVKNEYNEILLFMKGSDEAITGRIDQNQNPQYFEESLSQINYFSVVLFSQKD